MKSSIMITFMTKLFFERGRHLWDLCKCFQCNDAKNASVLDSVSGRPTGTLNRVFKHSFNVAQAAQHSVLLELANLVLRDPYRGIPSCEFLLSVHCKTVFSAMTPRMQLFQIAYPLNFRQLIWLSQFVYRLAFYQKYTVKHVNFNASIPKSKMRK